MSKIHPSAVIDPQAKIAPDVQVGPGCVIDGPVTIGQGCRLRAHVHLHGPVSLGSDNELYPFVCIGFEPQDRKYNGTTCGVKIGDRNIFREGVTIHCSTKPDRPTTVGDDNMFMTNSHLGHDVTLSDRCTIVTGAVVGGHAQISDDVTLGGNGAVHQFCRVGRLAFLGGNSTLVQDLPPFVTAAGYLRVNGLNLVGLRRSGVDRQAIDAVKSAFNTLYLEGHTNQVAAEIMEKMVKKGGPGAELVAEMAQFVRGSTRGLCPHAHRESRRRKSKE